MGRGKVSGMMFGAHPYHSKYIFLICMRCVNRISVREAKDLNWHFTLEGG
jgi:PHP family Zn ribbon phosphoesterase